FETARVDATTSVDVENGTHFVYGSGNAVSVNTGLTNTDSPTSDNYSYIRWLPTASEFFQPFQSIDRSQISASFAMSDGTVSAGWTKPIGINNFRVDGQPVNRALFADHVVFEVAASGNTHFVGSESAWMLIQDSEKHPNSGQYDHAEVMVVNLPSNL